MDHYTDYSKIIAAAKSAIENGKKTDHTDGMLAVVIAAIKKPDVSPEQMKDLTALVAPLDCLANGSDTPPTPPGASATKLY